MLAESVDPYSREKIYCEEAVILAAGAINTPQLLMLSGIGPERHLFVRNLMGKNRKPGVEGIEISKNYFSDSITSPKNEFLP